MIETGHEAPAFSLPAHTGDTVSLAGLRGKIVVLYFYPRDNTPGCTTEAIDFQAALPALEALGTVVLGVSKDSLSSHQRFAAKHGLGFALLSDPEAEVIARYGAWGEKKLYGKTSMGILRSTVIIDRDGRVAAVFSKVRVKGHVDQVVEAVRAIAGAS